MRLIILVVACATLASSAADAGPPVFVGAGDIASCDRTGAESTARLLDEIPGTVFTLGDNDQGSGTEEEFADCYDPTWGRHKARTRPIPGNHEYSIYGGKERRPEGASAYFTYFGSAAGDPDRGYYSYDLGDWHIIALNSNCIEIGGCHVGSAQERWLRADLAAHPAACTLAYWHHPYFSREYRRVDGVDVWEPVLPFWEALYEYGADVVLNAHHHYYERFGLQDPAGAADPQDGIRQFIVGTGGYDYPGPRDPTRNSEAYNGSTFGVLKLTLHPGKYEWEFIPEAGKAFVDSGSQSCHP